MDRMFGNSRRKLWWCSWVVASHTPLSAVLLGLSRRINTILSFTQIARQPNIGRVYGDSVEIASNTNACGIALRCLGSKLASRASGETCFLLVIPVPRPERRLQAFRGRSNAR